MRLKRGEVARSHRAYVENFLSHLEEKRSRLWTEDDIDRILGDMESGDEVVRASAVREICPCRMPDEVFFKLRKAAKRLQQDQSALVRESALHIEEDARMVASFEAQQERMRERDEAGSSPAHRDPKPWRKAGRRK